VDHPEKQMPEKGAKRKRDIDEESEEWQGLS
jgi:hypothetical protein